MFYVSDKIGDLQFLTITPNPGEEFELSVRQAYGELVDYLQNHRSVLLQERVYAPLSSAERIRSHRAPIMEPLGESALSPATFVEGKPIPPMSWAGLHAIAVSPADGNSTRLMRLGDRICGRYYQGSEAQHLFLSDVGRLIDSLPADRAEETCETIRITNEILRATNWSFSDVKRTWFYLDDILGWYNDFNKARNTIYHNIGLFNGQVTGIIPASTGIEGKNPRGARCTLDLLAMKPLAGRPFQVKRMINPKQNEAPDYGSAFSRGLSVSLAESKCLFVSGTASIDEKGVSLYAGDAERQVVRTMENVEALLASAGASLGDICQATAFVKRAEDIDAFYRVAERMGYKAEQAVCMAADVCREELLFEIDASAVLPAH